MNIIVLLQEISSFGRRGFEYGTQSETFYTLINDVINFMIISFSAGNTRFAQYKCSIWIELRRGFSVKIIVGLKLYIFNNELFE